MCPKLCNLCLVLLFCQIMSLTIAQYKRVYDHTPQESETLGFCYEIEEGCRVHVVQLSNSSHSSWHFLSLFSEKDYLDLVKVHWQICLSFFDECVNPTLWVCGLTRKWHVLNIACFPKNCGSSTYLIIERGTNLVANLHNSCSCKSLWTAKELTQAFEVRITYTMLLIWHY